MNIDASNASDEAGLTKVKMGRPIINQLWSNLIA